MNRDTARAMIKSVQRDLDIRLDGSKSQFGIRLAYVQAYDDMKELAMKITRELEAK